MSPSTNTTNFAAIIFGRSRKMKSIDDTYDFIREPLLSRVNSNVEDKENNSEVRNVYQMDPKAVQKIMVSCVIFGLLIGFFFQISTIGTIFLSNIFCIEQQEQAHQSDVSSPAYHMRAGYSIVWTLLNVFAVNCIISIARYMFLVSFNMTLTGSGSRRYSHPEAREPMIEEMANYFEAYFSLGVLISTICGWFGIAFVLDIHITVVDILFTLTFPLIWCLAFSKFFFSSKAKNTKLSANQVLLVV